MGRADFFKPHSWNVICDRCGAKRKAEDVALEWDGLRVCRDRCLEFRNPQDFVRPVPDKQTPPWTRPEGGDTFVTNTDFPLLYDDDELSTILYDAGELNTLEWQ